MDAALFRLVKYRCAWIKLRKILWAIDYLYDKLEQIGG